MFIKERVKKPDFKNINNYFTSNQKDIPIKNTRSSQGVSLIKTSKVSSIVKIK